MKETKTVFIWALLRIVLGWTFLWAFADKLWGLGYATEPAKSWLLGTSPTYGFLKFGSTGAFASQFNALAGSVWVDYLFMAGLLLIGLSLVMGIAVRIAAYSGIILMVLMFLALFPPKNNPFVDEHVIYILVLFGIQKAKAGNVLGFGKQWKKLPLVKNHPVLE